MAVRTTSGIGSSGTAMLSMETSMPVSAMVEGMERSIPPVRRIRNWAVAASMRTAVSFRMSFRLVAVAKEGARRLTSAVSATMKRARVASRLFRMRFI